MTRLHRHDELAAVAAERPLTEDEVRLFGLNKAVRRHRIPAQIARHRARIAALRAEAAALGLDLE